jgi:hypothetical protein
MVLKKLYTTVACSCMCSIQINKKNKKENQIINNNNNNNINNELDIFNEKKILKIENKIELIENDENYLFLGNLKLKKKKLKFKIKKKKN